ncbi:hypothetical protein KCU65_g192, partial [Aureobasidium melanogenum]
MLRNNDTNPLRSHLPKIAVRLFSKDPRSIQRSICKIIRQTTQRVLLSRPVVVIELIFWALKHTKQSEVVESLPCSDFLVFFVVGRDLLEIFMFVSIFFRWFTSTPTSPRQIQCSICRAPSGSTIWIASIISSSRRRETMIETSQSQNRQ